MQQTSEVNILPSFLLTVDIKVFDSMQPFMLIKEMDINFIVVIPVSCFSNFEGFSLNFSRRR